MAKDTEKVTLGNGDLFLNNVDVGHLKGDVEFAYELDKRGFKPSNMLGEVKYFIVGEKATLKASLAELKVANLKLAMGVGSTIAAGEEYPAADDGDHNPPSVQSRYDLLKFGGDKNVTQVPLRFVHTRPDGKEFIVFFYAAVAEGGLNLPFHEEEVTLHDITFKGLASATRSAGDQIGFFAEQVADAV